MSLTIRAMSLRRGALIRSAVGAAVLALGGCGGGSSSTRQATTRTTTSRPPAGATAATLHSGQSDGAGVIALGGVGSLSYRCDRARQVVAATLGGPIVATESVYVEGDDHRHLRSSQTVVSRPFAVAASQTRTLLWHVIQSTEPRTLDVRIKIDFSGATGGSGTAIGCSPTRWTSTTYLISHDKPWSPPPGWL